MGGSTLQAAIELAVTAVANVEWSQEKSVVALQSAWPVEASRSVSVRDLGIRQGDALDFPSLALACIAAKYGPFAGTVSLTSTLPIAAGLGSSAACLIATIAAVAGELNLELVTEDICNLAFVTESEWLRTGAGEMDFLACAFGGTRLTRFELEKAIEVTTFPEFEAHVVIGDSGTHAATSRSIAPKRARFHAGETSILEYQRDTNMLVVQMGQRIAAKASLPEIGRYITACHRAIASLMSTSTPTIDATVIASLRAGAAGAKLTGGGEGGCMFAIASSDMTAGVVDAMRVLGVSPYETCISTDGLVVDTHQ
jgi:mevalonate kinase